MEERWLPVVGFEGKYEISNIGRVRSVERFLTLRVYFKRKWKQKILKSNTGKLGYVMISLINNDGVTKTVKIHRLVAEAFIPNPDNKPSVNHKDLNKENNNISNIEWCTGKENQDHLWENKDVWNKIRKDPIINLETGIFYRSVRDLAKAHGVSRTVIYNRINKPNSKYLILS